jgi:hypothetical protein
MEQRFYFRLPLYCTIAFQMPKRIEKLTAAVIVLLLCAVPLSGHAAEPSANELPRAMGLYQGSIPLALVEIDDSIALTIPGQERLLPLRIVYPERLEPERPDPLPVIVLSHGTFSSGKRYDPVATYWAARGYIVILPDHIDANYGIIPKQNEDMFRAIRARVSDMSVIVDALDDIERQVPALAGRMDQQNLIAAGHSVGTQIAMMVTGLRVKNPQTEEVMESNENRFSLLIMLSDPGKMAMMPAEMWTGSHVPTLLSTGSEDFGVMGDGRRAAEYQNEILSLDDSKEVSRYLLLIERGDHYFGGLIHKDRDGEPDHEGLAIFNAVSVAFLDAYARKDEVALEYLSAGELQAATGGRAELTLEHQDRLIEESSAR